VSHAGDICHPHVCQIGKDNKKPAMAQLYKANQKQNFAGQAAAEHQSRQGDV
jgi:hypothetical protein